MKSLYPAIQPYKIHRLRVDHAVGDAHHTLYVEECGRPNGTPVVFLHDGPGLGCSEQDRRLFDPNYFRIVLFDQRGAGRSKPHASTTANRLDDLLDDLDYIRAELGIQRWLMVGGGWGTTLALASTRRDPSVVLGLVLYNVFLGRAQDIDWLWTGAPRLAPEAWANLMQPLGEAERADPLAAYHTRLHGPNELARMAAAKAWALWESALAGHGQSLLDRYRHPATAVGLACLRSHYLVNGCFLGDEPLLEGLQLGALPAVILHQRRHLLHPPDQAWLLAQAWGQAELDWIDGPSMDGNQGDGLLRAVTEGIRRVYRKLPPDAQASEPDNDDL